MGPRRRIAGRAFILAAALIWPMQAGSQGETMKDFPRTPEDRRIDELGSEARIHSPDDAAVYVFAAAGKFGLDEARIAAFKTVLDRLARAEYAAVLHPSRRIPESRIAGTFNRMMAEWSAPAWARTSIEEVHGLRMGVAKVFLPHGVSRSADGGLSNAARPVEAVYVLRLLEGQRPWLPRHKEEMEKGYYGNFTEPGGLPRFVPGKPPSAEAARQEREYVEARDKYLAEHSLAELTLKMQELLTNLGLD